MEQGEASALAFCLAGLSVSLSQSPASIGERLGDVDGAVSLTTRRHSVVVPQAYTLLLNPLHAAIVQAILIDPSPEDLVRQDRNR